MSMLVTQTGAIVRLSSSQKALITQAGAVVRVNLVQVRATQAGAVVRLALLQVRASQAGVLVRLRLDAVRVVKAKLEIDWNGDGDYTDETENLISARGEMRMTAPGSALMAPRGIVSRMAATLLNRKDAVTGRRYSPLNTASSLAGALAAGGAYHRPMRFSVSTDNGGNFARVFTGVIKIPQEGVPTPKNEATVEIECRSVDEALLQLKISTTQAAFAANAVAMRDEATLIRQTLEHADVGLTSADYTLDPGLLPIQWFWLDDESVLDELWQLAAAAGGRLYADPDGLIVYENMQHWLFHDQTGETLDRSMYERLTLRYDDRDVYSDVTVEASARRLEADGVLWEPDEAIQVPANGERTVTAKLRQPAYALDVIEYRALTSGGLDLTAQVTLSAAAYAQRVEMTFTNANAQYAATITGLQITGTPVGGGPDLEEKASSTAAFWNSRTRRHRSLRGNVYVQSRAQAQALAEFLRDTQETPRLSFTVQGLLGEPGRRLGDRIAIDDDEVMSAPREAYITGISWSFDRKGYRQTVDAIDADGVFRYDLAEYFIIGTDELGSGKRVFY